VSAGDGSGGVNIAAEIAMLRGEMMSGFTRLEGRLDLIASTQDRTARDVEDLQRRVTALEERRIPKGMLATMSGVVSAAVAAVAFLVQR
jgi:hypothetical protein